MHTYEHVGPHANAITCALLLFLTFKKIKKTHSISQITLSADFSSHPSHHLFILTHDIKYVANKDLNWAVSKIFPLSLIRKVYDTAEKKTRMNCVRGENLQFLFI